MGTRKALFELVDHACRICGGRILQRTLPTGEQQVRCAECGQTVDVAPTARTPYVSLCWCGVTFATGADAGLRCQRADQPTPERPTEVVVRRIPPEQERKPSHRPGPRPVRVASAEWSS
jgi:hypothetical protein